MANCFIPMPAHRPFHIPPRPPLLHCGVTLVELLVAMAVASIFLVSILTAFTQILRASEQAEAQVGASNQARAALLSVIKDVADIRRQSAVPRQYFLLENRTFAYGDGIDNDKDGVVDEEACDGRDNDGDWTSAGDRHAAWGIFRERPDFVGVPDLGDLRVDEDCKFGNDRLVLRIPPDPLGTDTRNEMITYEIGTFEGLSNVLLRTVTVDPDKSNPTTTIEPAAFNVLGFDVLAWNPNNDSKDSTDRTLPYWTVSWDALERVFPNSKPYNAPDGTPPFEFPASLRIQMSIYSGRVPLASTGWRAGSPVETLSLATTTDIELTIKDSRYRQYIRP